MISCIAYTVSLSFFFRKLQKNFYSSDLIFSPTNHSIISLKQYKYKIKRKNVHVLTKPELKWKKQNELYIQNVHCIRRYSEYLTLFFTLESSTHPINFFTSWKVNSWCSGNVLERKMSNGKKAMWLRELCLLPDVPWTSFTSCINFHLIECCKPHFLAFKFAFSRISL